MPRAPRHPRQKAAISHDERLRKLEAGVTLPLAPVGAGLSLSYAIWASSGGTGNVALIGDAPAASTMGANVASPGNGGPGSGTFQLASSVLPSPVLLATVGLEPTAGVPPGTVGTDLIEVSAGIGGLGGFAYDRAWVRLFTAAVFSGFGTLPIGFTVPLPSALLGIDLSSSATDLWVTFAVINLNTPADITADSTLNSNQLIVERLA